LTNRRIKRQLKENEWEVLFDKWEKRIDVKKVKQVEKTVDDLYQSEIRRKETIESKATSLFEAMGFAVALVSIAVIFADKSPLLIISLLPIANLVLSGICSWHATEIGEFFLPTLESVKENLGLAEEKLMIRSVVEKLVDIEMNSPIMLIKSNWLSAAYQHFLFGILLLIMFFGIIILEPYFVNILNLLNSAFLQIV
jgi:hypothetical protein